MGEKPILFSAPMVRAILAGTKTQTRRLVEGANGAFWDDPGWSATVTRDGVLWRVPGHAFSMPVKCPYGVTGDRLYVREAWRTLAELDDLSGSAMAERCLSAGYARPWAPIVYEADGACVNCWGWGAEAREVATDIGPRKIGRYRHARFMPRWASRILLEITDVRVQRLQKISEEDARAEGVTPAPFCRSGRPSGKEHVEAFEELWDEINGKRAPWASNPWVWCVSFKRVEVPGA